jgi:NAD+ synthase (glutamine-hydrolysing)
MRPDSPFFDPYAHASRASRWPCHACKVADPAFNAAQTIELLRRAHDRDVAVVAFPELGLSAYSCEDLFHQRALLAATEDALAQVLDASRGLAPMAIVGMRVVVDHVLFNCAVAIADGRILGVVPKTYLPNYGEFYEARQFAQRRRRDLAADHAVRPGRVPFGAEIVFEARQQPLLRVRPSLRRPLGADPALVLRGAGGRHGAGQPVGLEHHDRQGRLPPPAGQPAVAALHRRLPVHLGRARRIDDRRRLGRRGLIYEYGDRLAESARFELESHMCVADVDLERVSRERMRQGTFGQSVVRHRGGCHASARRASTLSLPARRGAARAARRPVPVRACRPGAPRRALRRGLQHPGAGARQRLAPPASRRS